MGREEERRDHTEWALKVQLRQWLTAQLGLADPVVLETHGGEGRLWQAGPRWARGLVLEKDPARCAVLERQRPAGWDVVCGNSASLLLRGYAAQQAFDLVDIDPHRQPWPTLDAYFTSQRCYAPRLGLVVTDSLRQCVRYNGGTRIHGLLPYVARYGRHVHRFYLEVCKERLGDLIAPLGYQVTAWQGQYGGVIKTMTYVAYVLEREPRSSF